MASHGPSLARLDSCDSWGEDARYGDGACSLQMQTFLDDWHYRVIHAGMADEVDRHEAVEACLGLLCGAGLVLSDEEKEMFALMDEDEMIDAVVRRMSPAMQSDFEHCALQLQLIVSTATRVRGALDREDDEEVADIMDKGDQGITQHLMKKIVMTAAEQIVELKDISEGWNKDLSTRLHRLSGMAEEQERNRIELDKVNAEIAAFHGKNNAKAVKAVTGLAEQNNATLLMTAFRGWSTWLIRWKGEQHIHEKYQAEIVQANARLKEMQGKSVGSITRSLLANADKMDEVLLGECVRRWAEDVKAEKKDKSDKLRLETEMAHLETLSSNQKAAAKRNLMRMCGANDESLITMCFTSWAKNKEEEKKQKDFEEREAKLQQQLEEMKSKGKGGAKGVLSRVSESSSSGATGQVFVNWRDHARSEKRARELEETMTANEHKFKSLNAKQKGNAKNAAQSSIQLEENNYMMSIFMNWAMEVEVSRVVVHYSGKMKGKKDQLEQVQSMFKDFSATLEQGISITPRTEKKGSSKGER